MAFRLNRNETVQSGVHRVAYELIDRALREAHDRPDGEAKAVHRCRRACKSLRALLRLVRPVLDEAKAENAALRDAARDLSAGRDRVVRVETAAGLIDAIQDPADADRARPVLEALQADLESHRESARDDDARLRDFHHAMEEARGRVSTWELDAEGFEAIAGGLGRYYKRGRKAMRGAAGGGGTAYHAWRKRTKDVDHHLRLLSPTWPRVVKAMRKEASALGDALGEHHDLVVLTETIEADTAGYGGEEAVAVIRDAADAHRRELERRSHNVGRRLYAEPKGDFVKRLGAYWQQWRLESTRH